MTSDEIARVVVEGLIAIFLAVQVWLGRKKAESAEKKADAANQKIDQVLTAVQQIDNRLQQIQSQAVNVTVYSGQTTPPGATPPAAPERPGGTGVE